MQRAGGNLRVKGQLGIGADEGGPDTIHDLAVLEKDCQRLAQLGLTLVEAKQLLTELRQHLGAHQAAALVTGRSQCEAWGVPRQRKAETTRLLRTLFGTVLLASPRLSHCRCQGHKATTCRPLTALLTESTTPALLFLGTRGASLLAYGMTARVLKDLLPVEGTLHATTAHHHPLAVARRGEEEWGEDEGVASASCPADGEPLSHPEGLLSVGLDGGDVRDWDQKRHHFEASVGKAVPAAQPANCLGVVQCYDPKARQRLGAVVQSQGVPDTQPLTVLSDGGETVRPLPGPLPPPSEHLLDRVHLTLRLTVLRQYLKGLRRLDQEGGAGIQPQLGSGKWCLGPGKGKEALGRLGELARRIDHLTDTSPRCPRLKRALRQFRTYLENTRGFIPHSGKR